MLQRVLVRLGIGLGLGLLLISAAKADEPRFEFTPFFTQRAGGGFSDANNNNINLLSKSGLAVAIDWPASEHGSQYELLFSKQNTTVPASKQNIPVNSVSPAGMQIEYMQIGGTTLFGDGESRIVPFASGGIGAVRLSPADPSLAQEIRWALSLGGGVRIPIVKHVRLRLEARGYLAWDNSSTLFCNSVTQSTTQTNSTTQASCKLHVRGSALFQYEALGGVSFGF